MSGKLLPEMTRRQFGRGLASSAAALAIGSSLLQTSRVVHAGTVSGVSAASVGPLGDADENGVRLPAGFTSRIVARSGLPVTPLSDYTWHIFPDGGATFPTHDGGWIYVSNCEAPLVGGTGAIRFGPNGRIIDAYPILEGTNLNCAGGPTPWGTWISCEEYPSGYAWECDPYGRKPAEKRPALGKFEHEAVAVDPVHSHLYLTEDDPDGRLYRYVPDRLTLRGNPDLNRGELQVAVVSDDGYVSWVVLDDPTPRLNLGGTPTREQVPESTQFKGGEGIWYHEGMVYFTTKGDNRVWELNTDTQKLQVIYDKNTSDNPVLSGVDNVTVSQQGSILVAEDGGDMQIVVLTPEGEIVPLLQIVDQDDSEITGPAFSPDGSRLYFSSQRGEFRDNLNNGPGLTYEITGPFGQIL